MGISFVVGRSGAIMQLFQVIAKKLCLQQAASGCG
jgi:hypothetical protein